MDVLYYPIAAFGVILLFGSNVNQRELFDVSARLSENEIQLNEIRHQQPRVEVENNVEVISSSFSIIGSLSELGKVCEKGFSTERSCLVATRLEPSVSAFLEKVRQASGTPELKLQRSCTAAVEMLNDLSSSGAMSSLVSEELISQYRTAVASNIPRLALESVSAQATEFKSRSLRKIDNIRKMMPNDGSNYDLVVKIYTKEVDFG
ncbi:hypothetical protein B0G80_7370 [Paraburkholderia sp. BL6669N2]|uniref:hypothetical protein n=1 Tax=Paraburkholderia sp. BL6669N2 TaxID=1938807 RepID=UPI000E25BE11|nr:hypothetical protein [Paraburkholderia sp. BL6669N2]REG50900.1 hypothetical protein B0G80_7370 [Paraburkholderia sp. BL6669N2]